MRIGSIVRRLHDDSNTQGIVKRLYTSKFNLECMTIMYMDGMEINYPINTHYWAAPLIELIEY